MSSPRCTTARTTGDFKIAARYLVDCSGGRTVIRPALGIEMSGSPYVGYFLSIFVRAPELWTHHAMGKAALVTFVDAKGLWRNLISLDGRELYRLGVSGKAYYDAPDQVDAEGLFREAVGKDVPHEILSVRRWSARNVVADRYQHGRIFLAGDAAHLNHPAAGSRAEYRAGRRGRSRLETVGDALPAGAARGFSDSYEPERRPVGLRNIGHADTSHSSEREQPTHPEIAMDTPAGAEARRKMGEDLVRIQTKRVITDGLALGYQYAPSPIVCSDGSASDSRARAPSITPRRSPAAARRTPGFRTDARPSICSATASRCCGSAKARRSRRPLERAFAERGVPLTTVSIADPAIAILYERALVLVRPDGHVAWRGDAAPADPPRSRRSCARRRCRRVQVKRLSCIDGAHSERPLSGCRFGRAG